MLLGILAAGPACGQVLPGSDTLVENQRQDPFRLNVGYETNGAALDGSGATVPNRFELDFAKDNLAGLDDASRLSFAAGPESNEVKAAFTVPFRRFDLSVDGSYSESMAGMSRWAEMVSRGGRLSGNLRYLVHRDRSRELAIDSSLTWRHDESSTGGAGPTPEIVSFGRIGFSGTSRFDTMEARYGAGLVHGLKHFGAIDDAPDIGRSVPRAQFWKLDGHASLAKDLPAFGIARLDLNAQWSAHPLYSDEQLVLGSAATVRGFTTGAAHADRGLILRSEFAPAIPAGTLFAQRNDDWPLLTEALAGLEPYLFADYGVGDDIANRQKVQRAGIGAGLRTRHGRVTLDASIGEPVFRRGGERPRKWRRPEAYVKLSVRLL